MLVCSMPKESLFYILHAGAYYPCCAFSLQLSKNSVLLHGLPDFPLGACDATLRPHPRRLYIYQHYFSSKVTCLHRVSALRSEYY